MLHWHAICGILAWQAAPQIGQSVYWPAHRNRARPCSLHCQDPPPGLWASFLEKFELSVHLGCFWVLLEFEEIGRNGKNSLCLSSGHSDCLLLHSQAIVVITDDKPRYVTLTQIHSLPRFTSIPLTPYFFPKIHPGAAISLALGSL